MNNVPRFQPKVTGVASAFELALRFTAWAAQQHGDLTHKQISLEFNVHRSTAYRWLAAWHAANGRHGITK